MSKNIETEMYDQTLYISASLQAGQILPIRLISGSYLAHHAYQSF